MTSELIAVFLARLTVVSVQSLVLVGVIAAVCKGWPHWPATLRCRLWWLASAQLVLGLIWPAPLELAWWPARETVAAITPLPDAAAHAVSMHIATNASRARLDASSTAAASSGFPWLTLLAWLWMTGVVMTSLQTLQEWQQARRWLTRSRECDDVEILEVYRSVGRQLHLSRLPRLRLSDDITSPQLLGPWRAVVMLPADVMERLCEAELHMALHHELGHLRRHDLWWGWVPAIARHLFFFHPAAHLAAREYAIAREAACDEAVLSSPQHSAHDYGRLLLRLGVAPRPCAGLASASPTYTQLKRRLVMLQNSGSKPRILPLVIVGGLVILAALPYRVVASAATAPAPAAAPKATTLAVHRTRGDDYAYILMQGDHATADAASEDFKAMARVRGDSRSPLLWVRQENRAYVIRDAATIERAQAVWKPVHALGEQQAALGEQQAALGRKQAALGQQMAGLGSRMADIGRQHAEMAARQASLAMNDSPAAEHERAEMQRKAAGLGQQQEALDRQQSVLGQQQSGLGTQQAALGEKQAALGEQQAHESDRAHREMQRLIDEAIRNGLAQPTTR